MRRLAEVEVTTLNPRIRELALNRGHQGCFKICIIRNHVG
ncbi:hypothetical protein T4E_9409 [Trichinella pseudospiralis]|uniref:Uncharacterized protein n=1 Tax=Trichinella pseudospiralis TaxID=6337 RepID=A0A0V0YHP0_TRIPS|nr:hypothetical protein T4E_9409 [Trichinella pseudospiralis]